MPEYFFPLKSRFEVADQTMAFVFDTSSAPDFTFEPGQNADYTLIDPAESDGKNMHTFSFAQSPRHAGEIMIATRMRDTAFKRTLKTMPIGTKVKVEGPLGNMVLHDDVSRPAVFLAGGIGITPFHSMIEWALHEQKPYPMYLFYGNRTKAAAAFHDEMTDWAAKHPNFHYVLSLTDETPTDPAFRSGRIDLPLIQKYFPNLMDPIFYIAGPDAMAMAMRKMLVAGGVGRDNLRMEAFSGY